MGCYILVQRGDSTEPQPAQAFLAVRNVNVTAYPSTASVPITVLLNNGLLLCGFNVRINGLMYLYSVSLPGQSSHNNRSLLPLHVH